MDTKADPFPISLAPFEHYMLADDRPEHPMTVSVRLVFSGTIDREIWQKSINQALAAHPLLRAQIKGDIRGRTRDLHWVADTAAAVVFWHEDAEPRRRNLRFDLLSEAGLRIEIRDRVAEPSVIIYWHHSCSDGAGMFHFIETLLMAYRDNKPADSEPPVLVRDKAWWNARAVLGVRWYQHLARLPYALARILKFSRSPTASLAKGSPTGTARDDSTGDEFCSVTFSAVETSALLAVARRERVTLNDLLLRDYFSVIHEWNKRHGVEMQGKKLRVAVPINLRPAKDVLDPAVNGVSMVFLDRGAEQAHDTNALLQGIHYEMQQIRRWGSGWILLNVLRVVGRFRGGVARLVSAGGTKVSSCLSNFGLVYKKSELANSQGRVQAGELTLERIEPFPPVRPGVLNSVGAITYGGRLTLTMNHDCTLCSGESARELLELLAEQLRFTMRSVPE